MALLVAGCPDEPDDDRRRAGDEQQQPGPKDEREQAEADPEDDASATGLSEDEIRQLEALGYASHTQTDNPEQRGVTTDATASSDDALNLYSARRRASAQLVDMDGEVVHTWKDPDAPKPWMHVEPLPSGDILAIIKDAQIARYDWGSDAVWRRKIRAHHDLAVHDDGRIFALVRGRGRLSFGGDEIPILGDSIAVLSDDGQVLETTELVPLMREHLRRGRLAKVREQLDEGSKAELLRPGGVGDVLHTNSIAFLEHDIEGVAPAGSVLLSFRTLSRIAILDAELKKVLWLWGEGELDAQHDATQLDSGHILIFDNGMHRGRSRVIELDAAKEKIVWSYSSPELFSRLRGGAQRLDNGHVLVTESDSGHALEVTREGEVVWEFWNPDVRGSGEDAERGVIYRMNRFPRTFFAPLSKKTTKNKAE